MVIFTALFHPNGFFVSTDQRQDFWVFFSDKVGWGRFSFIRPNDEFIDGGGLFELCEMRPANAPTPYPVVATSNVLWRRQEAIEAEKAIFSYLQVSLSENH